MKVKELNKNLKLIVTSGVMFLIIGCLITFSIIAKLNLLEEPKEQEITFIYQKE